MTCELAKQLKDAGFPQTGSPTSIYSKKDGYAELKENIYYPTLSELIEAIKEVEFRLHCYPHGYVIERINLSDMRICPTPEEAVARLYLKLHDKSKI